MEGQPPQVVSFSLTRGGPFHAVLRGLRLVRGDRRDGRRQAIWLAAIAWVPAALIALVESLALGRLEPVALDISAHARLLLAIPLLVLAERELEERCGRAMARFSGGRFAAPAGAVAVIARRGEHLRDSIWPEVVAFGLALVPGQLLLAGGVAPVSLYSHPLLPGSLTLASVYYWCVGLTLFNFLLFRCLWRWAIWVRVLLSLSRLRIRTVPAHPDAAGGLGHLAEPTFGLVPVLLAASTVVAATWMGQILWQGAQLRSFVPAFVLFVVVAELVALGPLLAFSGHLYRDRLEGVHQYSGLALRYTQLFQRRWIEQDGEERLLGTPDIQSLADLANSYGVVAGMRLVVFGPRVMVGVFLAVLIPMLPITLAQMSPTELLEKVGHALLTGLPR